MLKKYHPVKFDKWDFLTDRQVIFADGYMVADGQLQYLYILGYTMSFCTYLFLFYLTFILSNLLLFNLSLQNVYNLSTKFSTLKYRSENRSRKAGVTTCLKYLKIWVLCAMILTVSQRRWSLRWFRCRFWRGKC